MPDPLPVDTPLRVPQLVIFLEVYPKRGGIPKTLRQLDGKFRAYTRPFVYDRGQVSPRYAEPFRYLGDSKA